MRGVRHERGRTMCAAAVLAVPAYVGLWRLPWHEKNLEELPMRFHKLIMEEKLFDDQKTGANVCFVISTEQKGGIEEIYPCFPQDRVIVAPNGINLEKFKPREKTLAHIKEQTRKRQAALLHAAAQFEKEFPELAFLCVGTGPDEEIKKLKDLCEELGLKNTFLLGPRSQDVLAEIYTVSALGCFPSYKEPFGLVFVECMACKTPVVGARLR